MRFIDYKMDEARKRILERSPGLNKPGFLAALGNKIIDECHYWLIHPKRRNDVLMNAGYFGDELIAERAKRDAEEASHNENL